MTGSLASVHPELIPEWSEKNLPLTPDKITFGSNKRVWWKGACGHEWETSVKARSKGEKCPICSGARVIEGINDLATLKPLLAQEWSKKNKLKPTEVSVASHKKIIWKCKHGHEWEASVKSRTVNGTGCPYRNSEGQTVSYRPPRYKHHHDFYIRMEIRNNPYFHEIKFRINNSDIVLETEGDVGGGIGGAVLAGVLQGAGINTRGAQADTPGNFSERRRYAECAAICQKIEQAVEYGKRGAQPAAVIPAVPVQEAPKPKFCPNCGAPYEGGKFCQNCGSRI